MSQHHPSPLVWFRFHGGDLGLFPWLSFRMHCARCSTCRVRLRTELEERAAFTGTPVRSRAALAFRFGFPALAAAACVVVWLLVSRDKPPRDDLALNAEPDTFRAKGSSAFDVLVVRTDEELPLGPSCNEGDTLQARYTSSRKQVIVVGVDPLGAARVLFPLDGQTSQAIVPGPTLVPNSWTLDAQPGRERFVAFFSDEPLRAEDARRAALTERPQIKEATAVVRECTKAGK